MKTISDSAAVSSFVPQAIDPEVACCGRLLAASCALWALLDPNITDSPCSDNLNARPLASGPLPPMKPINLTPIRIRDR